MWESPRCWRPWPSFARSGVCVIHVVPVVWGDTLHWIAWWSWFYSHPNWIVFHSLNRNIQPLNSFWAKAIELELTIYELLQQRTYVSTETASYRLKSNVFPMNFLVIRTREQGTVSLPQIGWLLLAGKDNVSSEGGQGESGKANQKAKFLWRKRCIVC